MLKNLDHLKCPNQDFSDFAPIAHVQVALVVSIFEFVTSERSTDLCSFVDMLLKMSGCSVPAGCRATRAESLSFAAAGAVAGSEVTTESCWCR